MTVLSERKERKITLTDTQLLGVSRELAEAEKRLTGLAIEKKAVNDDFKERMEVEEDIIQRNAETIRNGYVFTPVDCQVEYLDGVVKYKDIATGEIIEERPMTDEEQFRMSENRVDAEQIIRQSTAQED